MEFGVGRGTVPREAESLGTVVASGDNEMAAELDRINREVFEESMEIIKLAWNNERFSFRGKHFTLPPDGIPDRGGFVTELTLVPRPTRQHRHLPAGHVARDRRVRAPPGPQGGVLAAAPAEPAGEVGPLCRAAGQASAGRSSPATTAASC